MTYDLDGNTLSDGTNTYTWDARNRLVSADNNAAGFAYDPLGRRTAKTLLSATTGFLYDGPNAVQEQNGTGVTANMLTGGVDEHFQRTDGTGSYSYLTDALGSTAALTDSNGNSDVQYSYGPYGSLSATGIECQLLHLHRPRERRIGHRLLPGQILQPDDWKIYFGRPDRAGRRNQPICLRRRQSTRLQGPVRAGQAEANAAGLLWRFFDARWKLRSKCRK